MDFSRVLSFLSSLCLHATVVGLLFLAPRDTKPMITLDGDMVVQQVTIGGPAPRGIAPQPEAPQKPVEAPAKPQEMPQKPPEPVLAPEAPEPAMPPEIPEPPKKAPEPVLPPEVIAPISEAVIEPPRNATRPPPVADPVGSALGEFGKNQPRTPPARRANANSIADALGDFLRSVAGDDDSGGSGDGAGILGTYQQSLVSRIKPHWEYGGRTDRRNPQAMVRIYISPDGAIRDAKVEQSSGDAAFDGSILKAIRDTGRVEPPPTPALGQVLIGFAYEALTAK